LTLALAAVVLSTAALAQEATGGIKGKVTLEGEKPAPYKLDMAAEKTCLESHKDAVFAEKTVVGAGGEIQWAFVHVAKGLEGKTFPPPATPVTINQQGCMYSPHVFGVMANQDIEIVNSDPILHNIHALPKENSQFNFAQPVKGMKTSKKFAKVEKRIKIKCDVHPWMSSFCFVLDHPFYAVTDASGQFEIKGLPPGEYGVSIWHETFKAKGKIVKVQAGKTEQTDFVLKAAAAEGAEAATEPAASASPAGH
jgi:hypothetical protein